MKRAVITGAGVVSPIGTGKEKFFNSLKNGTSGISKLSLFDSSAFPVRIAGEVRDLDFKDVIKEYPLAACFSDRKVFFGLAAFEEAFKDSGLESSVLKDTRTGIVLGLALEVFPIEQFCSYTSGNKFGFKEFLEVAESKKAGMQTPLDTAGSLIARKYGLTGPLYTNCSACAASTQALGQAFEMIRNGELDIAIAGGLDSMLNPLGIGGFSLLGALSQKNDSPEAASRPFDAERDGAVLGEGAGIMVIEEMEHALRRGAKIYCELSGYGSSIDAYKPTDPDPDGYGAARAMLDAIQSAGITMNEIDYINAHGTSTFKNDEVETLAIKKVFGQKAYSIPVSAVKSMTGHLIAASGAVETVACLMGFKGYIPPTINYNKPDVFCDLDYVPKYAREWKGEYMLKNSFGFGGQNASLVLRRWSNNET
ncbi:MAG TPA: beta-ketoacyl-[acyl-carrier-protein] synthase family protein [Ignavibacteriales bacterium]|nr:beta-ketoacyl-[acyl-carrier-protein] synthase family protein [Ignavibacteriales bacterium]